MELNYAELEHLDALGGAHIQRSLSLIDVCRVPPERMGSILLNSGSAGNRLRIWIVQTSEAVSLMSYIGPHPFCSVLT